MEPRLDVAATARFVPGASLASRALGAGLRVSVRPAFDLWARLPFDYYPPNLVEALAGLLPLPAGSRWSRVDLPDCPADLVTGPDVPTLDEGADRVILYLHGGAFLTCGLQTHRRLVARISGAAGEPVLSVGYRQMPHQPVARSVADGLDGLRYLLESGVAVDRVTIAGDSAGGYLAFAVARAAIDAGLGRPAGVVALSPLLDLALDSRTAHRNADRCHTFTLRAVQRLGDITTRLDTRHGIEGRIDPVDMELADLPPVLIQVGSTEILLADAETMANRLVAAEVPCELQIWDRQVHVFQAAASWVPEARAAIAQIGAFVADLTRASEGRDHERAVAGL